eukprot:8732474-Pyramimonas_sp.AAC.1
MKIQPVNAKGTRTHGRVPGHSFRMARQPPSTRCQAYQSESDDSYDEVSEMPAINKSHMRFVEFFRRASPYVETHRGSTFVLVIPGRVMGDEKALRSIIKVRPRGCVFIWNIFPGSVLLADAEMGIKPLMSRFTTGELNSPPNSQPTPKSRPRQKTDVALIHQLGVSLVLVIGSIQQIDEKMKSKGEQTKFIGEYRVTTPTAMTAAQ